MPIPTPAPPVKLTLAQKNLWRALHHVADSQLCGVWPDGSTVRGEHLKELVRELESEVEALLLQRAQEIAKLEETLKQLLAEIGQTFGPYFRAHPEITAEVDVIRLCRERAETAEALLTARAQEIEQVKAALKALRIDANRLCDRNLGGTYEEDCRRSIKAADAALVSRAPQPEQE